MAKGRMINSRITEDLAVHNLSDDTSRLAFTWLITFADAEGRVPGDPAILRSRLFPRRDDISIIQMEEYVVEWEKANLIIRYSANGDKWIQFPGFHKNNKVRKDREGASRIPSPPSKTVIPDSLPEHSRSNAGVMPESILTGSGLKQIKLNKTKRNADDFPFIDTQTALPTKLDKRKAKLSSTFWTASKIPEPSSGGRGWSDWQDGLDQLVKIEATEAELISAIKILDDNNYSYGGPGSLVKTIVNMRKTGNASAADENSMAGSWGN